MKNKYADLISCKTPEEVYANVRSWSSSLSDKAHLIRSTILDIHANLELKLKNILYNYMSDILFCEGDATKDDARKNNLWEKIGKMNFMMVYRFLEPCLSTWPYPEFSYITDINDVRNQATHGDINNVLYKKRNPFKDHDCLAQLYLDSWAIHKQLDEFYQHAISDPRSLAKHYAAAFYKKKSK